MDWYQLHLLLQRHLLPVHPRKQRLFSIHDHNDSQRGQHADFLLGDREVWTTLSPRLGRYRHVCLRTRHCNCRRLGAKFIGSGLLSCHFCLYLCKISPSPLPPKEKEKGHGRSRLTMFRSLALRVHGVQQHVSSKTSACKKRGAKQKKR